MIDISDTVISGSDSSLQIISLDDWTDRPDTEERIVKFKHISSQVISGFDLSYDNTSIFEEYNITNSYSWNNVYEGHITIEPSYQSSYSTYFGKYDDYSINNITSPVGNATNDVDTEIINSQNKKIIDISTSILGDIYFSFILNYLFKYNFKITTTKYKPITRAKMDNWVSGFKAGNSSNMQVVTDEYGPIGEWNTSQITDMSYLFNNATGFNENISDWNTSNVTNMNHMFTHTKDFNRPVGNWDTSKVTNMRRMFAGCWYFNQDIRNWDTSKVTDMNGMFYSTDFNYPINTTGNKWNTSNVTDMASMFQYAPYFNQNISNWDTSKVTDMNYMFGAASSFNQNISNWITSNVTDMHNMFWSASSFNQPINTDGNKWNTSNVTNMRFMFASATAFDKNISGWNTLRARQHGNTYAFDYNTNSGWHSSEKPLL